MANDRDPVSDQISKAFGSTRKEPNFRRPVELLMTIQNLEAERNALRFQNDLLREKLENCGIHAEESLKRGPTTMRRALETIQAIAKR